MFDLFSIDQIYILYWSLPINASKGLLRDQNHPKSNDQDFKFKRDYLIWSFDEKIKGQELRVVRAQKALTPSWTRFDQIYNIQTLHQRKNSESQHFHTLGLTVFFHRNFRILSLLHFKNGVFDKNFLCNHRRFLVKMIVLSVSLPVFYR